MECCRKFSNGTKERMFLPSCSERLLSTSQRSTLNLLEEKIDRGISFLCDVLLVPMCRQSCVHFNSRKRKLLNSNSCRYAPVNSNSIRGKKRTRSLPRSPQLCSTYGVTPPQYSSQERNEGYRRSAPIGSQNTRLTVAVLFLARMSFFFFQR